jgi:hypothetical protein
MSESTTPKVDINCPYALVARLAEVLDGIPDDGVRRVAAIHACARLIHSTAYELLPATDAALAGEMIGIAARLEKSLEAEHVAVLDPYQASQAQP